MKTKTVRSAIPIYIMAAVWAIYGLLFPLYSVIHIVAATMFSVIAYMVAGKFFPGHEVEVPVKLDAGDAAINKQLAESREALERLKEANAAIPSPEISAKIQRMETAGMKILSAVADKPARAPQVRKFMSYYLPTSAKLLDQYRALMKAGGQGEQVSRAMKSVENSLDMIASAFEKQLDNLYRDEVMDMTTDVEVLETMMKSDGLTETNDKLLKGGH